jgi:DUF1680 family protein
MDSLIALLARAQMEDGYIFTYNQIHFPGQRWVNLQIEHELYCLGHLIEAGVSHFEATGCRDLLDICIKAADLLVRDFLNASNDKTCGHEEIELALIRLYRVTATEMYLELARQFVERRGHIPLFSLHLWREYNSYNKRKAHVAELRKAYVAEHPDYASFHLPEGIVSTGNAGISTLSPESTPSSTHRFVSRRCLKDTASALDTWKQRLPCSCAPSQISSFYPRWSKPGNGW